MEQINIYGVCQLNTYDILHTKLSKKVKKLGNMFFLYNQKNELFYEGEMVNDLRHGLGILHNIKLKKNNIIYLVTIKGFFYNNYIIYGEIYDPSENIIYRGKFKNNLPNGEGELFTNLRIQNNLLKCVYKGKIENFQPIDIGYLFDVKNNICIGKINNSTKIINFTDDMIHLYKNAELLLSISK